MQDTTGETQLLQASLAGNTDAFGAIVERYQALVCGITYSATGDFAKSEELAQETFIRAWKGLGRLKDLSSFRAWLCTIARNLVRGSIKRKQREIVNVAQSLDSAITVETAEPGPSEIAISKEQQAVVWLALRGIPQTYREPMVLFYREQQSVKRVAMELGLSEEAVRQRLSRGRTLLRAEVATLVEDVLGRTGPKKVFTIAVISALPALAPQAASAGIASIAVKGSATAKLATTLSFAGAALGPLLGLLGSIIEIKATVRNMKSPRENEFMKKSVFLALLYSISGVMIILMLQWTSMRGRLWFLITAIGIYLTGIFVLAYITQRKRKTIQIEEGTYVQPSRRERTDGQIIGSLAGAIFSSLLWVHLISVSAKDWLAVWLILLAGILIFAVAVKVCLRNRRQYNRIAYGLFAAVGAVTLLIVNLRWDKWMVVLGNKPKYKNLSLWKLNLIIGAVIAVLLLMFLVIDLLQRRSAKKAGCCQAER
jgi:RNA polymerase sigma factor (sigma-70 family)